MRTQRRGRAVLVAAFRLLTGGAVFLACGGGLLGSSPEACEGGTCHQDGSPEGSSIVHADGSATSSDGSADASDSSDAGPVDAGGDARRPPPLLPCDDGGLPGALDPTFGDGGIVYLESVPGGTRSVVIQPDGKLLLGGPRPFRLVRLTAGGALDTAFGDGGIADTRIGAVWGDAPGLALTGDGRVLAGGYLEMDGGARDVVIARYSASGALDGTFGDGGVAFGGFNPPGFVFLYSIAALPDGHVLAAGVVGDGPASGALILKFNPNGSLDATFGAGGKVRVDLRSQSIALAMIRQPDERIVVVGHSFWMVSTPPMPGPSAMFAVRLDVNGSLDPTFGSGGKVVLDLGPTTESVANAVALDGAGRVVVGGRTKAGGGTRDFVVLRLTATGALDPSFGSGGLVTADFSGGDDEIRFGGLHVQPDGKYVAAGANGLPGGPRDAIARFLPDGSPDLAFGIGGKVAVPNPIDLYVVPAAAALGGARATLVGDWYPRVVGPTWQRMGASRYCL